MKHLDLTVEEELVVLQHCSPYLLGACESYYHYKCMHCDWIREGRLELLCFKRLIFIDSTDHNRYKLTAAGKAALAIFGKHTNGQAV